MRWLIFLLTSLMIFSSSACSRTGVSGLTALPDPLFDHDADGIPDECDSDFDPDLADSDSDGVIDDCEINLTGEWIFLFTLETADTDNCPASWFWVPIGTEYSGWGTFDHSIPENELIGPNWTSLVETILSPNPNDPFNDTLTIVTTNDYPNGVINTLTITLTTLNCDVMEGSAVSVSTDGTSTCLATSTVTAIRLGACDGNQEGVNSENEYIHCGGPDFFDLIMPDGCNFQSTTPINYTGDLNSAKIQIMYYANQNHDFFFSILIPSLGWIALENGTVFGTHPDDPSRYFIEFEIPPQTVSSITDPNGEWTLEVCDPSLEPYGVIENWCIILD